MGVFISFRDSGNSTADIFWSNTTDDICVSGEVKTGLLAMESPTNGDVEGMKRPGLEMDKAPDGLIHRQDHLKFCIFSPLLISPAVRKSLNYEWDWALIRRYAQSGNWNNGPVFNFADIKKFCFHLNYNAKPKLSPTLPISTNKNLRND